MERSRATAGKLESALYECWGKIWRCLCRRISAPNQARLTSNITIGAQITYRLFCLGTAVTITHPYATTAVKRNKTPHHNYVDTWRVKAVGSRQYSNSTYWHSCIITGLKECYWLDLRARTASLIRQQAPVINQQQQCQRSSPPMMMSRLRKDDELCWIQLPWVKYNHNIHLLHALCFDSYSSDIM